MGEISESTWSAVKEKMEYFSCWKDKARLEVRSHNKRSKWGMLSIEDQNSF